MREKYISTFEFLNKTNSWLVNMGFDEELALLIRVIISLAVIGLLAVLANYIAKKIIIAWVTRLSKKTENKWDDKILESKVLHKLSHLAPALVLQALLGVALDDYAPKLALFLNKLTQIYIVATWLTVISAFLNALHNIYLGLPVAKERPIKGYLQLIKILVFLLGGILIISILLDKDPAALLVGMGASAAILMLVFRDSILGLVASVQVSANNMVKPGDWISMPSRGADGPVLEITLNTVKVQNWDRTIATIPTYALVSESFTNWKGMEESDGRRIKRSIYIDVQSVKFCSPQLINKLKKIYLLKDYVQLREEQIKAHNKKYKYDKTMKVNGRRMTNIGMFRHYIEFYLKNNPDINTKAKLMVRQLQPTENGIPLEIYCFSKIKQWVPYEGVQADLFDHILAVVPEFELRIFQNPSGNDFQKISNKFTHS